MADYNNKENQNSTGLKITTDHDEIQEWIEKHDGSPAINDASGTGGTLAINFGDEKEFEPLSWEEFFDHLDSMNLAFQYQKATELTSTDAISEDQDEEGDDFDYSFIDRKLAPSDAEDDDNGVNSPNSDIPRENINPSSSVNDNDPDNMDDGESEDDGDAIDDMHETTERDGM